MTEVLDVSTEKADEILSSCRSYRKQLIEYCMKYLNTFEDAEDCVSFAYEALVKSLKEGKEIYNPKAWLYKVSLNEAIRLKKENSKRPEQSFADTDSKDGVMEKCSGYNPDYLDELVDDEKINLCALRIINALDSNEKELYIKYYCERKGLKDIADEMNVKYAAVRKRHQRLKRKLEYLIDEAEKNYFEEGSDSNEA